MAPLWRQQGATRFDEWLVKDGGTMETVGLSTMDGEDSCRYPSER